jgi:uncharacterized protein (UPF0335 family)
MSEMSKGDYIEKLQSIHSEIITLKGDMKDVLDEIKNETEFDGGKLNRIAAKRAAGKLSEFVEDLEETLKLINED